LEEAKPKAGFENLMNPCRVGKTEHMQRLRGVNSAVFKKDKRVELCCYVLCVRRGRGRARNQGRLLSGHSGNLSSLKGVWGSKQKTTNSFSGAFTDPSVQCTKPGRANSAVLNPGYVAVSPVSI
jgi:hypothetical protein